MRKITMEARERAATLSILMNAGLAIFKFTLGTLSGSVAIVADGIPSTSNANIAVQFTQETQLDILIRNQ